MNKALTLMFALALTGTVYAGGACCGSKSAKKDTDSAEKKIACTSCEEGKTCTACAKKSGDDKKEAKKG